MSGRPSRPFWQSRGISFAAFLVALEACTPSVEDARESAQVAAAAPRARAELRVVTLPFLSYAPLYIGKEEGFFAEQGLEVEFVNVDRSISAIPSLDQGEIDVVPAIVSSGLLNAIAQGARIAVVAAKGYVSPTGCPYTALVGRPSLVHSGPEAESRSKDREPGFGLARLKGRRVAVEPGSLHEYFLERLLSRAGLTVDDVEVLTVPFAAKAEALRKGRIDAAVMNEPWLSHALREGATLWVAGRDVTPGLQYSLIVYGPTLLDEDPESGARFMAAYLKGVRRYNEGKTDRNLDILTKHTGLDRELLREMCWPQIQDDGRVDRASLAEFQTWARRKGYLETPVALERLWDERFVERAGELLAPAPTPSAQANRASPPPRP